jgi:hypothetical protein
MTRAQKRAGNAFVWRVFDTTKAKAPEESPQSAFADGNVIHSSLKLVKQKFYMRLYRKNDARRKRIRCGF